MPWTEAIIYKEKSGEAPLLKWMDTLPIKVQNKWTERFDLLKQFGFELKRPICDYLRDEIYELRVRRGRVHYRVLYSFIGQNIVLLSHGCSKEKKVPNIEIDKAIKRRENYLNNSGAHKYIQEYKMSNKNKPTSDAVEIMHRRYIKGNKKRLKYIEQERKRVEIAQKIYELRTRVGLTQQELAELVGTRQSVISRLEDADYYGHTLKMLQKIADAVHCHLKIEFVPQNGQFAYPS